MSLFIKGRFQFNSIYDLIEKRIKAIDKEKEVIALAEQMARAHMASASASASAAVSADVSM